LGFVKKIELREIEIKRERERQRERENRLMDR
jgi:hypothetical protein